MRWLAPSKQGIYNYSPAVDKKEDAKPRRRVCVHVRGERKRGGKGRKIDTARGGVLLSCV